MGINLNYTFQSRKIADASGTDSNKNVCPVCGKELVQEKCKEVCRSEKCVYRIIYNCSEF
jgi:hypothetical protein